MFCFIFCYFICTVLCTVNVHEHPIATMKIVRTIGNNVRELLDHFVRVSLKTVYICLLSLLSHCTNLEYRFFKTKTKSKTKEFKTE